MVFGQVLHQQRPDGGAISVNVGGLRRRLDRDVLRRFPQTRLGRLLGCRSHAAALELCDDFSPSEMEFYFDRNPCFFCYVLNFYLTGRLHLVEGVCVVSFCQEMEYWGIREGQLASCCGGSFRQLLAFAEDRWSTESCSALELRSAASFAGSCCADLRRSVWLRLEQPGSSASAKALAVLSLTVVLGSIVSMCVHSMDAGEADGPDALLSFFDGFCVLFFSAEFVLRLSVAPSVRAFLCSALNVIDLMAVAPFYVAAACEGTGGGDGAELENVGKAVQILRLMRVFRIFKLARHSAGLRSLGATLRHSAQDLGQLLLFVTVGVFLFSTLVYFAEKESEESELRSIPMGWWWATISMTTVGYGDTVPLTLPGKLIGTLCILCGLLIVALPITNIFNKFSKFYQKQKGMDLRRNCSAPTVQNNGESQLVS